MAQKAQMKDAICAPGAICGFTFFCTDNLRDLRRRRGRARQGGARRDGWPDGAVRRRLRGRRWCDEPAEHKDAHDDFTQLAKPDEVLPVVVNNEARSVADLTVD